MKYRVSYVIEAESIGEALMEVVYPRIDQSTDMRRTDRISEVDIQEWQ